MRFLLALVALVAAGEARAFGTTQVLRSPEALLMGDAFTAVNDDAFTLFYNPATLGRHKADFTLNPLNPQFTGTNVMNDLERFEDFPDEPVGASKVLMDYPVHAAAGIAPGFKLFNVGVTFLATESYDLLLRNQARPMLDLDLRSDKGILVGVGVPLGTGRLSAKSQGGSQTTLGLGVKYLERVGVRDTLALAGPTVLDALGQKEIDRLIKSLGRVKGVGYGFDAGVEHVHRSGNAQIAVGLAALDITNTTFTEAETVDDLQVADIPDQVNLGIAAGQDFKLFHYILSADVRSLNENMELGRRLRFGALIGIPGLRFMAGVNSGYYSYGATLDLAFMKLTGGLYDVELGSRYKQTKGSRFILYLSLFDFSFDA